MPIQFHDPTAQSPMAPEPYDLSGRLEEGTQVALLANSFLDCDLLMAELATALSELRPDASFHAYEKDTTSPAPEPLIEQMSAECDMAVVAIAH